MSATTAESSGYSVIIIGAGLAGIEAAFQVLVARPHSRIAIVEARGRLGGRVCPIQIPASRIWPLPAASGEASRSAGDADEGPAVVDAGGAWVHGTHGNPLTQPYPDGLGATVRPIHSVNPWMLPFDASPDAELLAEQGIQQGPLVQTSDGTLSREQLAFVAASYKAVWSDVQRAGMEANVKDDWCTTAAATVAAALDRATIEPHEGVSADNIASLYRWALWNVECWMGASLPDLAAAEFANSDDSWGDLPGPHGPVAAVADTGTEEAGDGGEAGVGGVFLRDGAESGGDGVRLTAATVSKWILPDADTTGAKLSGSSLLVERRMQQLIAAAARSGSRVDVLLQHVCTQIQPAEHSDEPVQTTAAQVHSKVRPSGLVVVVGGLDAATLPAAAAAAASRALELVGSAVVITVPASVLRVSLTEVPALPPRRVRPLRFAPDSLVPGWKREAVAATRTGSYVKVVLRWPLADRWWPDDAPAVWAPLSHDSDGEAAASAVTVRYIENYAAIKGRDTALASTLVAVLAGETARGYAEAASTAGGSAASESLLKAALEAAQEMAAGCFGAASDGKKLSPPASWAIVEWDTDEFAGGAYSYLGAGCDGDALGRLGESYTVTTADGATIGLLAWAGEAADAEWIGSLHAAVRSGQHAATDVLTALKQWD